MPSIINHSSVSRIDQTAANELEALKGGIVGRYHSPIPNTYQPAAVLATQHIVSALEIRMVLFPLESYGPILGIIPFPAVCVQVSNHESSTAHPDPSHPEMGADFEF